VPAYYAVLHKKIDANKHNH